MIKRDYSMPECIAVDFDYPQTLNNRFSEKLKEHRCVYVREDLVMNTVPDGHKLVPIPGSRVRADHPITPLNPEKDFIVSEVRWDGYNFAARGEQTCWFSIDMLAAAPEAE